MIIVIPLCLAAIRAPGAAPKTSPKAAGSGPRSFLAILFSSEQNGYLTPCGCSKPMTGGIPRLATYLDSIERTALPIKVQNGDLTPAVGRQDELKAETLVGMFNYLKYDAINLGEKDFRLGVPYLKNLQGRFSGALLCANALGADGKTLFIPYVAVNRTSGGHTTRVVITGILSDGFQEAISAAEGSPTLDRPAAVLQRLRPELLAAGEVRVLLYHGPRSEAETIARQFPIFNLVVFGHEGDHPVPVGHIGNAVLAGSGQDGKYIGDVRLGAASPWAAAAARFIPLGPQFKEESGVLTLKRAYLDRVEMEDLLGQVPRKPTENGDAFAGSASCASCHTAAYHIWKDSLHARALRTLAEQGENKDPECVICHVVGLDRVSGFVTPEKTPQLANVGCEDCHGAAARHVHDPTVRLPRVDALTCARCHTAEQSPNFEFKTFWPKIRH